MSMFNYYCDEVKKIIDEVKPNYPQLTTYEKEWLYFHKHEYKPGTPVDLEYQVVEGTGFQTINNAIPFNYKSAILKGQTLVNLLKANKNDYIININPKNWSVEDGFLKCVSTTGWHTITDKFSSSIKPNTKYLIVIEIKENTLSMTINFDGYGTTLGSTTPFLTFEPNEVGTKKAIVTTISTIDNIKQGFFRLPLNIPNANSILKFRIMAIEYQEGMENWDISYFEGMQSAHMPVLTTTGKNLFGGIIELGGISTATGLDTTWSSNFRTSFMRVPKNNTKFLFTFNYKGLQMSGGYLIFIYYNENKELISSQTVGNREPFNFNQDAYYYRITQNIGNNIDILDITNIQLEEGTVATSYEPYKSNILTVSEDVTLRSNGDVYDELNLLTGRLTQRIDENNEVLAQEVVKTVDLTDKLSTPYEGTNHYVTYSDKIPPIMYLEVPIVSTGDMTLLDIQNQD